MRRAVGHGRERHLDRLRPVEQPQRPQRRLALGARRPFGLHGRGEMMLRGRGQHRAFGDMRILRQMHDDALSADARGDAVDQRGQLVIVVDMGVEIALLLHHDLGAAGGQPDQIEAEAGIEGIGERIEPFAKQAVDDRASRHRTSGLDHDRAHRAVGAEEARLQPPRALALLLHRRDQRVGQTRQRHRDHGVGRDRLGKAFLHDVIRQRLAWTDRRIALPQRMREQRGEPAPNRAVISWRAREATSPMVFRPARRRPVLMVSPAPSADTGSRLTAAASPPSATMVPEACRVSVRAQTEVPAIAALTAKPWRSARRTTVCNSAASPPNRCAQPVMSRNSPCGGSSATSGVKRSHQSAMSLERLGIGRVIGVEHLQIRTHRAGIGQRQADMQAEALGGLVQRMDHQRVVLSLVTTMLGMSLVFHAPAPTFAES